MVKKATPEVIEELKRGVNRETNYKLLFERYYAQLYRFFQRKGVPPEDCRDLVQEVFAAVYRGLQGLRDTSQFQIWLFKIATNVYKNEAEHRRAKKRAAIEVPIETADSSEQGNAEGRAGGADNPIDALLKKERREMLSDALHQLPPQMRRCVYLRVVEGLSNAEIAALMGVTVNTVKAHLYRAKQVLKKRLDQYLSEVEM